MNSIYKKQFRIIKKHLGIEKVVSIRFSNTKTTNFNKYKDTACTVLARSLKNNILTYIDRENGQLCPGGDYFLNITHPPTKKIYNVYVKNEKVFQNNATCFAFLKKLPKYPFLAQRKYILFAPLIKEILKPDVIIFLATPAQVGRILGLSVYKKISNPLVIPALSTCASIYASIELNIIHTSGA